MNKSTLKSIGAVVAGFLTIVILSVVTDFILESLGIFTPPDQGFFTPWMLVVALIYRSAFAVIGGYLTARLAPSQPMRHVIILASIGTAIGILGSLANLDKSPIWYPALLIIFSLACVLLGGKLRGAKINA